MTKKTMKKIAGISYSELEAAVKALPPETAQVVMALTQIISNNDDKIMLIINRMLNIMETATLNAAEYVKHVEAVIARLEAAEQKIAKLKSDSRKPHGKKPATRKLTRK
jgi:hypothetical protein